MSFAPKQFIRSVDFLSTENAINTSTGCVNIFGGMSVSRDSYLTNMIVVGNSTLSNVNVTGALITSTGNTLVSSQWNNVSANGIYFGTSASAFVGIGTTTPTFNLDISGGSRITGGLTVGNLNVNTGASVTNILNTTICTGTIIITGGALRATFNSNTVGNIFTTGGNVGIGTTSPGSKLEVNGTIKSGDITVGNINFTGNLFQNGSAYLGSQWTTTSGNTLTYTSGNVSINSGFSSSFNSNTVGSLFTTGGNIGIGTTSPNGLLSLWTPTTASIDIQSGGQSRFWISQPSGRNILAIGGNGATVPSVGAMNIDNAGRVGIATSSPAYTLDVIGTIRASTSLTTSSLYSTNQTSTNIVATNLSTSNMTAYNSVIYLRGDTNHGLRWAGNGNSWGNYIPDGPVLFGYAGGALGTTVTNGLGKIILSWFDNGRVGVGTTSPSDTLDVSGTIRATTSLTTGSLYSTNQTTTNVVGTNITTTNLLSTNITSGTIRATTLITSANIASNNLTSTNLLSTNITSGTIRATTVASSLVSSTTYTGANMSLSGNLNVSGTLTTVNITSTNLVNTNVSAGVVVASTLLSATANSNTLGSLFTTGGNVGIGTNSPTTKLDINGNIQIPLNSRFTSAITDNFIYSGATVGHYSLMWNSDIAESGGAMTYLSGYGGLRIFGNGSPIMNITRLGNVGINTTSPAYTLDVTGSGDFSTFVTTGALYSTNQTTTNIVGTNLTSSVIQATGITTGTIRVTGNADLSTGLTTVTDLTGTNITSGTIRASTLISTANLSTNNITSSNIICTNMTISNIQSGGLIITKQTGNPDSVQGNFSGYHTEAEIFKFIGEGDVGDVNRMSMGFYMSAGTIGNIGSYPEVNLSLRLNSGTDFGATPNIPVITFLGTRGNVGIGTNNPSTKLHLSGDQEILRLNSNSSNEASIGFYPNTAGSTYFKIGNGISNFIAQQNLVIFNSNINNPHVNFTNAGNTVFTSSGNVGIGTASPGLPLHVAASNNNDTIRLENTSTTGYATMQLKTTTQTFYVGVGATNETQNLYRDKFYILGGSAPQGIIMTTGGNVGLNTLSPTQRLEVNGNILNSQNVNGEISTKIVNSNSGSNAYSILRLGNNSGDAVMFLNSSTRTNDGGTNTFTIRNDAGALRLQGGGATNTIFLPGSSSNVGIGTTSPSYALHVSGDIYATGDVISFSDARLKTDVVTINNALDKVSDMRGVYYTNLNTNTRETGVIAQEIADILPEVVGDRGEYLGVAYGNIVGILIEAIKELKSRIVELESRN